MIGGTYPRWSRDGKQLYYIGSDGLMVAEVAALGPNFEVLSIKRLFQTIYKPIAYAYDSPYDIAPDGRRFLFVTAPEHAPLPIALVINWTAGLEKHSYGMQFRKGRLEQHPDGSGPEAAFRHAGPGRIEVEVHYDPRRFRLRVRDNGKA